MPRDGRSTEAAITTLKLIVGPGDQGEPVITIRTAAEASRTRRIRQRSRSSRTRSSGEGLSGASGFLQARANARDHGLATLSGGQRRDTPQLRHGLLGQAAVFLPGTKGEGLIDVIREVTYLKRRHRGPRDDAATLGSPVLLPPSRAQRRQSSRAAARILRKPNIGDARGVARSRHFLSTHAETIPHNSNGG